MNLKLCALNMSLSLTLALGSAPAHAGNMSCDGTAGLDRFSCGAMMGVILLVGGAVVAYQEISAALTPSRKMDARLEGGSEILNVKLNGLNNRNYTASPTGREKPMLLRCARQDLSDVLRPGDPPPGVFAYGRCVELRPSFKESKLGAGTYWTYLAYHPLVSFGFSKDGQTDTSEAELDKRLEPEKLPRLTTSQMSQ